MFNKAGRAEPALPQYRTTMKREVKKAMSRIRKAQDAVYNNATECSSLSVDNNSLKDYEGKVKNWWTIFVHREDDPQHCRSWRVADDDLESIESTLQEISEYMNYQV